MKNPIQQKALHINTECNFELLRVSVLPDFFSFSEKKKITDTQNSEGKRKVPINTKKEKKEK